MGNRGIRIIITIMVLMMIMIVITTIMLIMIKIITVTAIMIKSKSNNTYNDDNKSDDITVMSHYPPLPIS